MPLDVAWVALSIQPRIGLKVIEALRQHFAGDLYAALAADSKTLQRVPGIGAKTAASIRAIQLAQVQAQIAQWQAANVYIIPYHDPRYPHLLHDLAFPPATLFVRGAWPPTLPSAALVGTRTPGEVAQQATRRLAGRLVEQGCTIVSGLAYGIDQIAHQATLNADGRTIAVLGCGVRNIYPPAHQALAENLLAQGGTLVSEAAPDAPVSTPLLVSRNRIISGLSQHVVIIETAIDGGAMHAARSATAQGRRLYTLNLPGASGNQALLNTAAATPLDPIQPHFNV